MKRRSFVAIPMLALAACGGGGGSSTGGGNPIASASGARISIDTDAGPLSLASIDSQAGAIGSLTWNGMEFIDAADHGRLMQSAVQLNGLGEGLNPTEGGSIVDGVNLSQSSSVLVGRSASATSLETEIQMAYWHPVNGAVLSPHTHRKAVKLGALGDPHLIEYQVSFDLQGSYSDVIFEVLTAYMPPNFSVLQTLSGGSLTPPEHPPAREIWQSWEDGPLPHVFSTPDGAYAMGAWSPGIPQPDFPLVGFGAMSNREVVKWNVVRRLWNTQGTYTFTVYVAVGSLSTVVRSLGAAIANPSA